MEESLGLPDEVANQAVILFERIDQCISAISSDNDENGHVATAVFIALMCTMNKFMDITGTPKGVFIERVASFLKEGSFGVPENPVKIKGH